MERKSWVWREYKIHERLDECFLRAQFVPRDEYSLRKLLEKCFREVLEGVPIQIIPHLPQEIKAPGCPRVLFVLVGTRSFADRTLEALEVARRCRGMVEAVLYLTVSWSMNLDNRLRAVTEMFRDYGVLDICRREPITQSPIIWY